MKIEFSAEALSDVDTITHVMRTGIVGTTVYVSRIEGEDPDTFGEVVGFGTRSPEPGAPGVVGAVVGEGGPVLLFTPEGEDEELIIEVDDIDTITIC